MPLQRLRRVLSQPLNIDVDSTDTVAQQVNARARPAKHPKTAVAYPPVIGTTIRAIRPIDLLRKIGEVTTPRWANLARLSASWATRRYFWCIHDYPTPTRNMRFKLSLDARRMERHQKTLLSDEFGVGFAALLMEEIFGASQTVDIQFALSDPRQYFDIRHRRSNRMPDYLMWAPNGPTYIVECKGCQTSRAAAVNQLRRAMEQIPTIEIPGVDTPQLAIATHLHSSGTSVYILDPPTDDRIDGLPRSDDIRKKDKRTYVIENPSAFKTRLQRGTNLQKLRWISQHTTASELEQKAAFRVTEQVTSLPNANLEVVETEAGLFTGISSPIAPELGYTTASIFRGIPRNDFEALTAGDLDLESTQSFRRSQDAYTSVGPDGVCLIAQGLD